MNQPILHDTFGGQEDSVIVNLIKSFGANLDTEEQIAEDTRIINQLTDHGSQETLNLAGSMCLDIAARDLVEPEDKEVWIQHAHSYWEYAIEKWWDSREVNAETLRSGLGLVCLGASAELLLDHQLASTPRQREMLEGLATIGEKGIYLQQQATQERRTRTAQRTVGVLGELAMLMPHQIFTSEILGDASMLALPSWYSQDRSWNNELPQWDISIYTQFTSQQPEIAYRAQVKSRYKDQCTISESSDQPVQLVCIGEDLAVTRKEQRNGTRPYKVVQESIAVVRREADESVIDRLTQRIDLLLERLDRPQLTY